MIAPMAASIVHEAANEMPSTAGGTNAGARLSPWWIPRRGLRSVDDTAHSRERAPASAPGGLAAQQPAGMRDRADHGRAHVG